MSASRPRILILAGTAEASALAHRVAERWGERADLIVSLAGRTRRPKPLPGHLRTGGFGGADGLAAYLETEGIAAVIDATHPFAAGISQNADRACRQTGCPLLRLERPAWTARADDTWISVPSLDAAALRLPQVATRALLTVGSNDLAAFSAVEGPVLFARTMEPPAQDQRPRDCDIILDRGPFDAAGEKALFSRLEIDCLVTKNSGGTAVGAKLDAARGMGIAVLMVERPALPDVPTVNTPEDACAWLRNNFDSISDQGV